MSIGVLLAELKRRRVFRVLIGYGLFSFAVLQVIEPVLHAYHLPDWTLTAVVTALAFGFPVATVLSWIFDLTVEGVVRTPATPGGDPRGGPLPLAIGAGLLAALLGLGLFVWWQAGTRRPPAEPGPPVASIAVLPFTDFSPGHDQDYFSDGIAEEILNALAQVEGLRVTGRTSSFSFKGKAQDLRAIGASLGVATVLEGSVRKAGSRIRISAQLVKTADGFHLWSQTFDRELADVFAVQEEIAGAVVAALRVKLLPGTWSTARGATSVKEAHDHFLLGRDLLRSYEEERARRALSEFERAVALDPGYALAWAGIANALRYLEGFSSNGLSSQPQRRQALEAAERAVALGPDLPDGYVARARIRRGFLLDWAGARADLERARALGPGDAFAAWASGQLLMTYGELPAALAQLKRAVELDPLSAQAWTTLGQVQLSAGDHRGARVSLARALEIAPLDDETRYYHFASLLVTGQAADGLKLAEAARATWIRYLGLAMAHHDLGHAPESEAALAALIAADAGDAAYQVAEAYAWRGEREKAFEWLERARVQADTGLGWIKVDPLLARLRADPRYPALLRALRLPAA
jgi:TolB-like protein/tetratricopeptide (TPR) repeat protein